ncbi:MAG: GtrA family protein [Helicobacteraceae bacterium]|jgi:putative flippase GtrA|nr:GtrA family protein [Helicobacteraceae bacterium]
MNDKSKSIFFDRSLAKFMIVGLANVFVGSLIMFGLYNLAGCGYWLSSAANYLFASALSFYLNKRWTFQNKEGSARQIIPFALNIAICYFIAYSIAKPLIYYLLYDFEQTIRDNIALFIGMCFFTALNYFGQRFFVFKSKEQKCNQLL